MYVLFVVSIRFLHISNYQSSFLAIFLFCCGISIGGTICCSDVRTLSAAGYVFERLYFIDLLFDAHFCKPEALVDTPFLEDTLHLQLALVFGRLVALAGLASLRQDDHLVHILLTLYQVLIAAWDLTD